MLYSMTGFGKAEATIANIQIKIEIRALNSKGLDLSVKCPSMFREFELPIRNHIAKQLQRGKVDVFINAQQAKEAQSQTINQELVQAYIQELKHIAELSNVEPSNLIETAMRLPNVLDHEAEISEDYLPSILALIDESCQKLMNYREKEGAETAIILNESIGYIQNHLLEIPAYEQQRIDTVRQRIVTALEQLPIAVDDNRLEQELIYYIEKFDIAEEKTRLTIHINHFKELMQSDDIQKGKKMSFLTQEIGREINTIGSKANHVQIQQHVVEMKDHLEQIKEQLANTL